MAEEKKVEVDPKYIVYSDDEALGKDCPSLANLKVLHNNDPDWFDATAKKTTVLFLWAKFAKGDYTTVVEFSRLSEIHRKDGVQFIGVSTDLAEKDVQKFIDTKVGTFQPTLGEAGLDIKAELSLAFDPSREVHTALKEMLPGVSVGVGMAFLINKEGKIVWREQYSRGKSSAGGMFEKQLLKLKAGEELLSNGASPEEDESDGNEEACSVQGGKIVIPGEGGDY